MAANVEVVGTFTDNASGGLSGFAGNLGNLGNIVTGIKSAFDLAGQAIDAAVGLFKPFVDSASESEQAVARLDGVLRATGGAVGLTSEQLQDMANSLQNVTRFSDETIEGGEAILLTFRNIGAEMFQRTVPAMADMAEIFGSVDSAAMQLGKALNDPLTGMGALSRAGITFSEEQKDMIKNFVEMGDVASAQNIILTEVENQVKGLAETMGNTFAGQVDIAKNALDTLKETIGGAVLPTLTQLTQGITTFINTPEVKSFVNDFAQNLSTLFSGLASGDITFLDLTEMFKNAITAVDWDSLSQDIANGLNSIDWAAVSKGMDNLSDAFTAVLIEIDWSAVAGAVWESLIQAFTVVIDNGANSLIDLLAVAFTNGDVSALQTAFKNLWGKLDFGFDDIGKAMIDGVISGVQWAWGNLKYIFSIGFDDVIAFIKTKLGIASPSTVFAGFGQNIVEGLIQGWTGLFGAFKSLIGSGIDDILKLFAPFLALFGVDTSSIGGTTGGASGTFGGFGGGTTGGSTGGVTSGGSVVINIYGASYWGVSGPGDVNGVYDCPSPHPLVASSGNQLVTSGF